MPVHLLPSDTTAAERASGCVWSSRFESPANEIDKGGVITGTPRFEIGRGVTLDGVGDCIQYALNGQLNNALLGIHAEFYPTFAPNNNLGHFLCDCTGPRTLLCKDAANNIVLHAGNSTLILTSALAAYQAHWVTGGRNVLTSAASSGANVMWLNGQEIATSATAWVASNPTVLHVGSRFNNIILYSGRIASLQFYNRLLTANDHARLWEGGGA